MRLIIHDSARSGWPLWQTDLPYVTWSRTQAFLGSNDMMPKHNLHTVHSTAQKRHFPKCTTICCRLPMMDRSLCCARSAVASAWALVGAAWSRPLAVFVTSCIDYCNVLLAGAPKDTTDSYSHRLLNAAARLVGDTRKFDRGLRQLMHVNLHWLDVPEWVKFKLVPMVHNCLHHKAPRYLTYYCRPIPISYVASRWHLRSARRH